MVMQEELTYERVLLLETTIDELRADLRAAQDEKNRLAQELKHTENERLKANERTRSSEESLKKAVEQGDLARKTALQEKNKARQMQKRVDDLLQEVQTRAQQCVCEGDAKSKKKKDSVPDVLGLQRGLDKKTAQLKKKQDEFQAQAQSLQQMTVKYNDLEQRFTDAQKTIKNLESKNNSLISQMKEEHLQATSDELSMKLKREKYTCLLALAKEKSQAADMEIARLNKLLHKEEEKALKRKTQTSEEMAGLREMLQLEEERRLKLVERLSQLEEQLSAGSYECLGDADIADRIRIRNLFNHIQERLAIKAGLESGGPGEHLSQTWRTALGPSMNDASRVQRAKELLAGKTLDQHDEAFLAHEQALRHVCQHYSRFRKPGNDLHQLLPYDGYLASIRRYLKFNPSEDKGDMLFAMVKYIFPLVSSTADSC